MLQLDNILLAHDLTDGAQRALSYALKLAAYSGGELRVSHVLIPPKEQPGADQVSVHCFEHAHEHLRQLVFGHEAYTMVDPAQVRTSVLLGTAPASALLEAARRESVDLIVTGSHDKRRGSDHHLGSVAEEIARRATCPVLTVHEHPGASTQIKRILVPIDFSQCSARALQDANALAAIYGATLVLLFVAEERHVVNFSNKELPDVYDVPPDPRVMREAEASLRELGKWTRAYGTETEYHAIVGRPHQCIATFAEERDIDLIVISTHGKSALRYFDAGSVTEAVVRSAPCPVLTVRAFGKPLTTVRYRATETSLGLMQEMNDPYVLEETSSLQVSGAAAEKRPRSYTGTALAAAF